MGAQLSLLAQTSPSIALSSYIDILDEVHYVTHLNSSRFLKTCKALDPNGEIIIKVFIKPTENYSLQEQYEQIRSESLRLAQLPNILNYSKIIETDRAGYLIRQHLKMNLYDRLSSRPFLQEIELKFLTFQLLQALEDLHSKGSTHGDLKTENILVTSWGWLIVTDVSSFFKPVYLPDDNPGEFSFYFDTSGRRSCYVAPERFNSALYKHSNKDARPTKEMDVFSAGCCIAEMFSEGQPTFNLSELFKYKTGEYAAEDIISPSIKNTQLRSLISDMIQLRPEKRLTIPEILLKYRDSFFPSYFYTFTYEYFRDLAVLNGHSSTLNSTCSSDTLVDRVNNIDGMVTKVYQDYSKICSSLHYPVVHSENHDQESRKLITRRVKLPILGEVELQQYKPDSPQLQEESALLFLTFLLHAVRNLVSSGNKLKCLELITALSQYVSDGNKLDRVLPFVCAMFFDTTPTVQGLAIQSLTQILSIVSTLTSINDNVFVDYILPRLKQVLQSSKNNPYVRMILADSIGDIAASAVRFQEISQILRPSSTTEVSNSKKIRRRLVRNFEEITVALLTDVESSVKLALLENILPVCNLFGREKTNDIILSHLITYLNDKNSLVRIKLVQAITGIVILLGPITLEQYVLPLLIQTITDSEELVVVNILQSLKWLCQVGMMRRRYFYEIAEIVTVLLLHPNAWIRQFSLLLILEMSSKLSKAEVYCILYPIIRPYFEFDVTFSWESMFASCKKPVSRNVYNLLCTWSLRATKTLFWKQVPSKSVDSFGNNSIEFITKDYTAKNYGFNSGLKVSSASVSLPSNKEIPLTTEDKNWLDKLRAVGLHESETWKLAALRTYVFRVSKMLARKPELQDELDTRKAHSTFLNSFIMPRNVFFDVDIVDENRVENSHLITENKCSSDSLSTTVGTNSHRYLPLSIGINGSLILSKKASPTIRSNLDNVYVQLEPSSEYPLSFAHAPRKTVQESKFVISNSYDGDVPTVKQYLRNVNIKPYLKSYREFGPCFNQSSSSKRQSSGTAFKGKLHFHLTENRPASIVKIITSEHKPYCISGSDQGVLKLWDLTKLRDGEMYEPPIHYDLGSSIVDLRFLPNYDVFAAATRDGSISFLRVCFKERNSMEAYSHFEVIRKYTLKNENEYATNIQLSTSDSKPYALFTTNYSKMIILDIRTTELVATMQNNQRHGAILSCTAASDLSWFILGTSKGILDLWDSRFRVLVKSWTFAEHFPITHIEPYPSLTRRAENNIVLVGGSRRSLVSVWDISKAVCREVVLTADSKCSSTDFIAVEKGLEDLTVHIDPFSTTVSAMHVSGHRVYIADRETGSILMVNFRNKAQNCIVVGHSEQNISFSNSQLTSALGLTIRTVSDTAALHSLGVYFHTDIINSFTIAKDTPEPLLISGDNSGVINIYR
ncbi:AaceriADL316Cp [[Ashbya] aceris (nom. inval.)]|nr:AaceriADL316Cp [[Ashbya] aceris (nom. inval.)]